MSDEKAEIEAGREKERCQRDNRWVRK